MVNWELEASLLLKAELARKGINYPTLVKKLAAIDVIETEASISGKLHRGSFRMAFFLQCMKAIGVDIVSVAVRDSEK